jgi:hypothetical protein
VGLNHTAVCEAVYGSLTAEFTTTRGNRPMTVPVTPFYDRMREMVVVTAAPAFAGKAKPAAADPCVSLLLHNGCGRLHLRGRATIRDADLEANAAVVERLLRNEPPLPKRAAMTAAADFLDTRLGLLTLDWYGLRILIEIEPTGVERRPIAGVGATMPAWPAADMCTGEAARYDRAVATVVSDGWPRSWALSSPNVRNSRLRLSPPADASTSDGQPVCVLVHWHDEDLSALEQRVVRGRCRVVDDDVWFDPASSSHLRNRTALDRLRFVVDGKRRTRAYFAERGEQYRPWPDLRTLAEW